MSVFSVDWVCKVGLNMKFEDHFSTLAETYAQYRPHYPAELFAYLASLTPEHRLAWDCATGSGQAALGLVDFYEQIIATDASEEQVCHAQHHEKITYIVQPAEQTGFRNSSIDLLTVAVAVHWFDFDRFYTEVNQVLKVGGVIAVWCYHRPEISPEIDRLIATFEDDVVGSYWPERKRLLSEHYVNIPFPFEEIQAPAFNIHMGWTAEQMLGFINSWSAVKRYQEKHGVNPLDQLWEPMTKAWGSGSRSMEWPIYLRVGNITK